MRIVGEIKCSENRGHQKCYDRCLKVSRVGRPLRHPEAQPRDLKAHQREKGSQIETLVMPRLRRHSEA